MLKLGLILMSLGACAGTSHRWGYADASMARAAQPTSRGFATASAGQPTRAGFTHVAAEQSTEPTVWGFAEVPTGRTPTTQSAQR